MTINFKLMQNKKKIVNKEKINLQIIKKYS